MQNTTQGLVESPPARATAATAAGSSPDFAITLIETGIGGVLVVSSAQLYPLLNNAVWLPGIAGAALLLSVAATLLGRR